MCDIIIIILLLIIISNNHTLIRLGNVLRASYFIILTTLWGWYYYYSHFQKTALKKSEVPRGQVICFRSRWWKEGFILSLSDSRAHVESALSSLLVYQCPIFWRHTSTWGQTGLRASGKHLKFPVTWSRGKASRGPEHTDPPSGLRLGLRIPLKIIFHAMELP